MEVSLYSRILVHHPCAILMVVFVFSSTCLIVPLVTQKFPDFSDPQLGFEARGTPLAQRITAWKNLMDSSSPGGHLTDNPLEYYYYLQDTNRKNKEALQNDTNQITSVKHKSKKHHKEHKHHKKHKAKIAAKTDNKLVKKNKRDISQVEIQSDQNVSIENSYYKNESEASEKYLKNQTDGFFCNVPNPAYARVVVGSAKHKENLWSLDGILAQCHIDATLRASSHFPSLCQQKLGDNQTCCRSWSPANYVALLSNRTSCSAITEDDLSKIKDLMQECHYFYRKRDLTHDCTENFKCQLRVPAPCYAHDNAIYYLFHYLLDIQFLSDKNNASDFQLSSVMIILPVAASSATLDYYRDISVSDLSYKNIGVTGMQFGLKSTLFDRLLISDSLFLLFGFIFVTICIWSYTESFLITLSTILVVIFSLGISYAIYVLVLRITLFPFMNLLGIVVAVGIGSDDAFIFCKVWECNKRQKSLNVNSSLIRLVHETMKHAVPTMFVSTLTTAVAFFASIVSNVTAINCFSLFSGMTVIVNFLLMITWLPASVVIAERCGANLLSPINFIVRKIIVPLQLIIDKVSHLFTNYLVKAVILLKWLWFFIFLIIGIGSCYVVFRYPGLQLPDSPDFQLFDSKHLFERYDLFYIKRFWFEIAEQGDGADVLPLRFIWGVLPVDNGNYFNPESRGSLVIDENFNISDPESQVWLQNFCENVRLQTFYRSTLGPLLPNCFIESLRPWMSRSCQDPVYSYIDYSPCCESSVFPYEPKVLKQCAAEAISEIYRTPSYLWNFKSSQSFQTAGLKFRKQNESNLANLINSKNSTVVLDEIISDIVAVIVEYDSNFTFSLSFAEMNNFYNEVESWMQKQLLTAPPGMKNGWFISHLEFYELQRTLYEGTIWAIVVSMGLALSVLALVTLNPFVSLYAILTVGGAIVVTVAILVLIGWKLNVLESIAVSTAIGLAVDFSLHYGVSYRASTAHHRIERVKTTLEQMGGPTLMAALTTGAAGALMLPSQVLAYIQIGIFLVIIMGVSWIYATFFLCPLLVIAGPSSRFAQFRYPKFQRSMFHSRRRRKKDDDTDEIEIQRSTMKKRREPEEMLAESSLSNVSTTRQFDCDSSLPPSANVILLNADVNQRRSD